MKKKKLAFIDHSFHRNSAATSFLIDLLGRQYDLKVTWDEAWNSGAPTDLREILDDGYDTVVLFQQIFYKKNELKSASGKNLILVPMYDNSQGRSYRFWEKFKHVKIINFSKVLHAQLEGLGLMSKYFQYFPPSQPSRPSKNKKKSLSGFFWQRTDQITWNHIRELIKGTDFERIHLHTAVDPPGYPLVLPPADEVKKYNISSSGWFSIKDAYLRILNEVDVFFAPRLNEGIGMAFLEAMARGKCVVAPDKPTMNEYIIHGKTGILYDPDNVRPIDFSNIEEIGRNAVKFIEKGYAEWLKSEKELMDFIERPFENPIQIKLPPFKERFSITIKETVNKYCPSLLKALAKIKRIFNGVLSPN